MLGGKTENSAETVSSSHRAKSVVIISDSISTFAFHVFSLGAGFENMMRSWVIKLGAQQGLGVVASRWLGGGKAKAQGRGMGLRAIACHLFRICLNISAFCLNEKGCWRTSILCTHIHEFLNISHLFHFIYFIVICNI